VTRQSQRAETGPKGKNETYSVYSFFSVLSFTSVYAKPADWNGAEKVLALKGKAHGDMLKLTFPRSDLSVKGWRGYGGTWAGIHLLE